MRFLSKNPLLALAGASCALALVACGGSAASTPSATASTQAAAKQEPSNAVVNGGTVIYSSADFESVQSGPGQAFSHDANGTGCEQDAAEVNDVCQQASADLGSSNGNADLAKWTAKLDAAQQVLQSCMAAAAPGSPTEPITDYQNPNQVANPNGEFVP